MRFVLIGMLTLLITLADLWSAWLYQASPEHWGISAVRFGRDGLMLALALWGLTRAWQAWPPFVLSTAYVALIVLYAIAGPEVADSDLMATSAAKLLLPVLLLSAGAGTLDTPWRLRAYGLLLGALALASTVFGNWDIRHTEFWTDTLEYGHYLNGIKGIVTGFDGYYVLPFNFFGYGEMRRAAGLVAAPLAQGSFVAIGALAAFAVLQRRAFLFAMLVLAAGMIGVWQSGTRGAMLVMAAAVPLVLTLSGRGGTLWRNLALLGAMVAVSAEALKFVLGYSINLEDGSTIGHVEALQLNLEHLDQVMLVGPGLGAAGATAADMGVTTAGGGEGAVFAIAYQIGMPGMLLFLALYAVLLWRAFVLRTRDDGVGDAALACLGLGVGFVATFISSDHLFSLSGMGVFWIWLGGVAAQVKPPPTRDTSCAS